MQAGSNSALPLENLAAVPSGVRAVILERDRDLQARLQRILNEDSLLSIAVAAMTWPQCEGHLQEVVPELLIARPELVPPHALSQLLHCTFPVQLWIGIAIPGEDVLVLPDMDAASIRTAVGKATAEIFRRKACELSRLLELYLVGTRDISNYVTSLKLPDKHGIADVPVESILLISASGNYIRVHTIQQTYELRETLSSIASKLNVACFARVHRSHIVNLGYVCKLVRDQSELHVVLNNGTAVPVGPNYREEIASILADKMRLIA